MVSAPLTYNATLIAREDLTDKLALFRVAPDQELPAAPWFDPGQYLVLGLNNETMPELGSVRRPMSVSSGPHQRDAAEFYIRYVSVPASNNPFTHLLWKTKIGDRIYLKTNPTGHFSVRQTVGNDDRRRKIFVAAGTGLAPFVAYVRARLAESPDGDLSDVAILHGASYPDELGYFGWLRDLASTHNLAYLPTVSRASEVQAWMGPVGRVEDFFLPARLPDTAARLRLADREFNPSTCVVYVCGLTGTIAMSVERLLSRGFLPDNNKLRRVLGVPEQSLASLFFEQYDTEPVIDVKDPVAVSRLQSLWQPHAALAVP